MFTKLGFTVNRGKSVLEPVQRLKFLGYSLDSTAMSVEPTMEKREKIVDRVNRILHKGQVIIRQTASLLGLLNDVCKGVDFGLNHVKFLEMDKIAALREAGAAGYDGVMTISGKATNDLIWWLANINTRFRKIRVSPPDLWMATDASGQGWGAVVKDKKPGGRWASFEVDDHINVLKLRAVFFGLKSLFKDVLNSDVKVISDSVAAVAYLKHMGGTKSAKCNEEAHEIWLWCEKRNVWLWPVHTPGSDNREADFESRNFSENTEWMLNPRLFKIICKMWGEPHIDLFASRLNNQVQNYVSWFPDPNAQFVDAFSLNWSQFEFI